MATQITNYQCPACMGPLHFVGESGMLECDYCGSRFSVEDVEKEYAAKNEKAEDNFEKAQSQEESQSLEESQFQDESQPGMKAYVCPSCASEIVCDENTAATSCPYCGNPTVVPGQFRGELKPDYIIPFKLSHEEAKKALKQFYKGKRLLPKEFSGENRIQKLQGVYVPFWLYDSEVEADVTFDGTIVEKHRDGDYDVTETSYYEIYRKGSIPFCHVPVDASEHMPDGHMDAIEPFDYDQMKPFSMAYLPGYLAERYGKTAEESAQRAETRMENTALDLVRKDVQGFTNFHIKKKDVRIREKKASYVLLPVYLLTTKYQGKDYLFAMNGQTGRFIGDLPISKKKYWMYFGGILTGCTVILGTLLMLLL